MSTCRNGGILLVLLASAYALAADRYPWEPRAVQPLPGSARDLEALVEEGRRLFIARFTRADGAGRPTATGDSKPTFRLTAHDIPFTRAAGPDANSCAGCHFQPGIGGSGDFAVNVFVGAQFTDPPTTSLESAVTNERNTLGMFGAGAIELLAREMTEDLQAQRDTGLKRARASGAPQQVLLETKGVRFGAILARPDGSYGTERLEGVDTDLVIKPFGVRGVVISLREFTINALNHHHGMQAVERFGWERTGMRDFDGDGVEEELGHAHVTALTLFQALLPAPERLLPAEGTEARRTIDEGARLFERIGCAECHRPRLPLRSAVFSEPNPYNRPGNLRPDDIAQPVRTPLPVRPGTGLESGPDGTVYVAAFTDLKRHRICDEEDPYFCNERLRQDFVPTDQFLTMKLWDVGSSMPYGHRGDCTTVTDAILHHSAEGAPARRAFLALRSEEKGALVRFLYSLTVTEEAASARPAVHSQGGNTQ